MTTLSSLKISSIDTYTRLRRAVREALVLGQQKIETLKVETYWKTGKYLHEHILHHKNRADYGEYVLSELAKDIGVGKRLLERTLQFYRKVMPRGKPRGITLQSRPALAGRR